MVVVEVVAAVAISAVVEAEAVVVAAVVEVKAANNHLRLIIRGAQSTCTPMENTRSVRFAFPPTS